MAGDSLGSEGDTGRIRFRRTFCVFAFSRAFGFRISGLGFRI